MVVAILIALALGHGLARAEACVNPPHSQQDVIHCAEARSPAIQNALLEVERARAQIGAAEQWKNPEIAIDSYNGKVGSERRSETEIGLGIPVELGGKLSSRRAVAEGGLAEAEASLFEVQAQMRTTLFLRLHRLRQITHELEVIDESISTFKKLVSQYGRRPKLSPEQELSSAVFRMAQSEYDLKRAEIQDEIATLDSYFKITVDTSIDQLKDILPQSPKAWPKIASGFQRGRSPQFQILNAQLKTAQAELSLAQSESWPTVTLGPSMKLQSEAGRSDTLYGFNLNLPIPLFNVNGAGRRAAATGVALFEARRSFGETAQQNQREELLKSYQQSVAVLMTSLSHQQIEKQHGEAERLFLRGVVPSSLVIEAHRTFVELERSRNQRELKALETLMSIHTLDGTQPEVN